MDHTSNRFHVNSTQTRIFKRLFLSDSLSGNLSIDNLLDFFFIHNFFINKYNIIINYYTINKNYSENIHTKNEESKNQH